MWLTNLLGLIYFTALCATQDTGGDAFTAVNSIDGTTLQPMSSVTPTLSQEWAGPVYTGESLHLRCSATAKSPDWTYQWFHNDKNTPLLSSDPSLASYTIASAALTNKGKYWCQSKRGEDLSVFSNSISLDVTAPPRPSLNLQTQSLEVFPSEKVEMSCGVEGSSDWTFTWYRQEQKINTDSSVSLTSDGTLLTILKALQTDSGSYFCKGHHKTRSVITGESDSLELRVIDLPEPSLKLQTPWLEVFPSEKVEMSCEVEGSSDWTFTWYRQEQKINTDSSVSLTSDGTLLTIPIAMQTDSGSYICKGHHKTRSVITGESHSLELRVIAPPMPSLKLQTQSLEVYSSEKVEMSCGVEGSSDWTFTWYRQGQKINTDSSVSLTSDGTLLTIPIAMPTDSGSYICKGHHKTRSVITGESHSLELRVIDLPEPSLKLQTPWLEVFPSEKVEMSCEVEGSSDWTFTWYRQGQKINTDSSVSLTSNGTLLTILKASQTDSGSYFCKGHHKIRSVITGKSKSLNLQVHDNKPKPTLDKDPTFNQMYVGESLSFSCGGIVSSGWEYLLFKDGTLLQPFSSRYNIRSLSPFNGGIYNCKARRGKTVFLTEESKPLTLNIAAIPVPKLELKTPWAEVFPGERTEFSCAVQGSPDWTYTWCKDGLSTDPNLSVSTDGSSLTMVSAKYEYKGSYTCRGQHKSRPVKTDSSKALFLVIHASTPKPLITQAPRAKKMYIGEKVSFKCTLNVSSGWEYVWFKNGTQLPTSGNSLQIQSLTSLDSGNYTCMAKRGTTIFSTPYSDAQILLVHEIPVPSINPKTSWLDVFPNERLELSCAVKGSSDWSFTFIKDGQNYQGITAPKTLEWILPIHSASDMDSGEYKCRGRHKSRSVTTRPSSGITVKVYDTKPVVVLRQEPAYKDMFIGESLSFHCEVNISSGWEYHLFKDSKQIPNAFQTYIITSAVQSNSGAYGCQANRGQYITDLSEMQITIHVRPWAVMTLLTGWSEVFSTDSLVLSCEVHGSQDQWNYTWFRKGEKLYQTTSNRHIITPKNNPNQSEYTCQGTRTGHPSFSTATEPFKTKNLLLKRRVLLAISGCLFFGIVAVFLGCIILRVTRKPDKNAEKQEEPNLFLTMAELKARDDAPIDLVDYDTEEALIAVKDGEDTGTTLEYNESTPLPITSTEQQAVPSESTDPENNAGLTSFKY